MNDRASWRGPSLPWPMTSALVLASVFAELSPQPQAASTGAAAVVSARPVVSTLRHAFVSETRFRGRDATRVVEAPSAQGEALALVGGAEFDRGEISAWVAGLIGPAAPADARGFVGIAFRTSSALDHFDAVYLRPGNARAEDQLRRNHATQYVAHPAHPWRRLRLEAPGQYESYTDLDPVGWNHLRLVVDADRVDAFVNQSAQPVLIVRGLRGDLRRGGVALWIGEGTIGYFADVRIVRR